MDALNAIEGLDDGAYSHFDLQNQRYPDIVWFMQPAYYYSSYVGVAVLFAIVVLFFLVQGKRRGAVVALISFASAVALLQAIHIVVPRPHPPNADKWLGAGALSGSYPSAAVFLFTLCLILLAFALWDRMGLWMRGAFVVIAAALVGWVCMSGFFLALHYVTDVIGGLTGAALVGWIASRFIAEPVTSSSA
jgi:membrane-associated phospholipid phosphatase